MYIFRFKGKIPQLDHELKFIIKQNKKVIYMTCVTHFIARVGGCQEKSVLNKWKKVRRFRTIIIIILIHFCWNYYL